MPRRSRRDETASTRRRNQGPTKARSIDEIADAVRGPSSSQVDGSVVQRSVKGDRLYRCPYCQASIAPGTSHIVAYPVGRLDDRRHYHTGCWTKFASTKR
ncbi:MAG: hypothetical protein ABR507_03560 [Actinomycetota bacterium]|nr:hypothetical protein [Actinomycetota bacterium]